MSFFHKRTIHQEWWLGLSRGNRCGVTYKHGDLCSFLTVISGLGAHATGGTYSSLLEWKGNRAVIEEHLVSSGAAWFLPLFEKGMDAPRLSEEEVLEAFTGHFGFEPVAVEPGKYPVDRFEAGGRGEPRSRSE